MAKYTVGTGHAGSQQAMSTAYKTLISLTASTGATTLRKAWIYDIMMGTDGAPSDNSMNYRADRQSTLGTQSAATPSPLDSGDAAALIIASVNYTAEPTTTAATMLIDVPANVRATYRWTAVPGGELVVAATHSTGIGFRAKSSTGYTSTAVANLHFWE